MTHLVLVVDDEPNIVLSLEFLIDQADAEVSHARSAVFGVYSPAGGRFIGLPGCPEGAGSRYEFGDRRLTCF